MSYYAEVRKARSRITEVVKSMGKGDEVLIDALVLDVVTRFEVGEKLVRAHLRLLASTDESLELTERALRRS